MHVGAMVMGDTEIQQIVAVAGEGHLLEEGVVLRRILLSACVRFYMF